MRLSTPISLPESGKKIRYSDKSFFLGSCFADNIGEKLQYLRFNVSVNPFGVYFNPISIANLLDIIIKNKEYPIEEIEKSDERCFSYDFHSKMSAQTKLELQQQINEEIKTSADYLKNANFLFISLGTAFVYERNDNSEIVANCHKQNSKLFNKKLLSVEEVFKSLNTIVNKLKEYNTGIEIIFTISPVRHIKDGAHENNISKSILFLALTELQRQQKILYFPSYEIVLDELRDYRFYGEDLVHPNKLTVTYVFEKFCDVFMDDKTMSLTKEVSSIVKSLHHRVFDKDSLSYKKFIQNLTKKTEELLLKEPNIQLKENLNSL
jgi:GSCFA family